jgi:hypothetical protein
VINEGGPAFPTPETNSHYSTDGMSLRDYFAGQALPAVYTYHAHNDWTLKNVVERAYQLADAMLAERQKESQS